MRVGLDLRHLAGQQLVASAVSADALGLWAILVGGDDGTEHLVAAEVAIHTKHVHLATWITKSSAHPVELAEEIAIVDHLSRRRMLAVIEADHESVEHTRRLLAGHIVNGVSLAPPPAQTAVPVWSPSDITIVTLTGDLETDRVTVDRLRDSGSTHVFIRWPGELRSLARHLVTRALGPDFPQIAADHADVLAP